MQPSFLAKLNRATKHIEDLDAAIDVFFKTDPYVIRADTNPDRAERSYKLVRHTDIPNEIVMICADALYNMRSALDHLACRLVESNGNVPTTRTAFPIADSAQECSSSSFRRKIEGM